MVLFVSSRSRRWSVPLALLAGLSTLANAPAKDVVAQARSVLENEMVNYSGAKIRAMYLRDAIGDDGKRHLTICGQINAPNRFGGFTGWQHVAIVLAAPGEKPFLETGLLHIAFCGRDEDAQPGDEALTAALQPDAKN